MISYKYFKFQLVAQRYYEKQKTIYLSNNNLEHFDVWSRSTANTYQRNKQDFSYRNGCANDISKKKKRLERIKNEHIKVITGVKEKPDIIERKSLQWYGHVKRMQEKRLPKLITECIPGEKKKKRTSKKNVDGRCTSSHENKTFRMRSVVKQKGMVSGFRKTATAVTRP
jgi:hypothetical protein